MSTNKEQDQSAPKEPLQVLLADDDRDDRELFEDALNETGVQAELTTVNDGQELIDHLKDPSIPDPDILFVDINMPVKSGDKAVAEIKADPDLKNIPTVMLSTSDTPDVVEKSFKAGADLYVQKPSSYRNFVKLLQNVFAFHWAGRLLRTAWNRFFVNEKQFSHKDSK